MSTTTKPMLSTTHAIFRGLQDDVKKIIATLPPTTPPKLKKGLLDAHHKLSDYYYKYDDSPFYTWAALLDPRISYTKGLKRDYKNDADLDTYLESSKQLLQDYFDHHYPSTTSNCLDTPSSPAAGPLGSTFLDGSPQKVDFTSQYDDDDDSVVTVDELERYFSLPKENFRMTNPPMTYYQSQVLQ
ncbi:uncharacterized protein EV420DRAFT_1646973 [Desarmillaria tabescens]|uniref:Uncharacterized protein n=1 Tax=Armillaria tabescens TaxID=1929756 RepID=A0AA39JVE0_ARMTA|nr:uncharacterized protein EV420DRAFT_1646973 [Desarmillaria tabescens]KAK0449650.1 hypothetical protein EV420DRAFT_1646973 [Desarmillaria tabescens]